MASSSSSYLDALWEAVKDDEIPDTKDGMCWPLLKMSLKRSKVDMKTRSRDEWMEQFHTLRRALRKEDTAKVGDRSSSTESERKSDVVSLSDSAYQSESPQDHVCYCSFLSRSWIGCREVNICAQHDQPQLLPHIVFVLVEPSEDWPDGRAPAMACYSDATDEDYIIQTILSIFPKEEERLLGRAAQFDWMKKGWLTSFSQRKLRRRRTTFHRPSSTLKNRKLETSVDLFQETSIRKLGDEETIDLGRKVALAVHGANTLDGP